MFPNDCGPFIFTGSRFKQCNDFRYVILRCPVNFWVAIRVNFWVAIRVNFWVAMCLNVGVAMYFNF